MFGGMLTTSIILGFIILMLVEENSNALELLKKKKRKAKTCTRGGPRACGWDEIWGFLAYFKDICAMYQVNCRARGRFSYVVQNNEVCRLKSKFVGVNKTVFEADLPTSKTTKIHGLHGVNRTKEWWWQGSSTDQYKYLENMEVS